MADAIKTFLTDEGPKPVDYTALANLPTIDSTPTSNSNNLVSSGGVYTAINNQFQTIDYNDATDYNLCTQYNNIYTQIVYTDSQYNTDVLLRYSGTQTLEYNNTTTYIISYTGVLGTKSYLCLVGWDGNNTITMSKSVTRSEIAPLASPAFTGVPTAPTAAAGTHTTQIATTAFVTTAIANAGSNTNITTSTSEPTSSDGAVGDIWFVYEAQGVEI